MKFSLKRTIADSQLEPFEFEDATGEPCELPHMLALTPAQAMLANEGKLQQLLEEIAPDINLMDLPTYAIEALFAEWAKHSGIEIDADGNLVADKGNFSTSSRSSTSTAKPSKRTSRSAGSKSRR